MSIHFRARTASSLAASTKRRSGADRVMLSANQIARLNGLTPAAGERHEKGNMAVIES
jgi:hypothetical protein